jgi:hypothetical protein
MLIHKGGNALFLCLNLGVIKPMPTTKQLKTIDIDELCHFTDKQNIATTQADSHTFTLYGGS